MREPTLSTTGKTSLSHLGDQYLGNQYLPRPRFTNVNTDHAGNGASNIRAATRSTKRMGRDK